MGTIRVGRMHRWRTPTSCVLGEGQLRAASGKQLLGVQVCGLRGPLVSKGRFGGAPHRPTVEPLAALAPVLLKCPRLAVF